MPFWITKYMKTKTAFISQDVKVSVMVVWIAVFYFTFAVSVDLIISSVYITIMLYREELCIFPLSGFEID